MANGASTAVVWSVETVGGDRNVVCARPPMGDYTQAAE